MYRATIAAYISRLTTIAKWQICLNFSIIIYEMSLQFYAHIKPRS